MSDQDAISEAQFAEAVRTVQAFITQSPFQFSSVKADIGGMRLEDWSADQLAKFDKVHINLTIELRKPGHGNNGTSQIDNNLVSSSLFAADPETYYNDVVAGIIQDITHTQDFYQVVEDFVEQTVRKALEEALAKSSQNIGPSGMEAMNHYSFILKDIIANMKNDSTLRSMFNSHVSQKLNIAVQNPEFLARSRLLISRQLNQIISSQALVTDEDYAQIANNYLQMGLDDFIRNVQMSISKDIANNSVKIPANGVEMGQYIRSKILEQQEVHRSRIQLNPSQQIKDVAQIRNSMLDLLNNDEKLNQFLNGVIQSKINFAIQEARKQGHADINFALQNDPTISQVMHREINEYIAQLVVANLTASQILIKSQVISGPHLA